MRNTLRAMGYHGHILGQKALGRTRHAKRLAQEVFATKSLIFCVTNGRSGTSALASLFACIPNVRASHEEKPSFHLLMRWVQCNPDLARDFWLFTKLPAIAKSSQPIYVETSHLFGKGFLEPLLTLGGRPKLVFLKRNPRLIAKSMLALGDIPGRSRRGLKWYLAPTDPVFRKLDESAHLTDYQLCFWHALETEARQQHYRQLCHNHGLGYAEADADVLNDLAAFEDLCAKLGIELDDQARQNLKSAIGRTLNSRDHEKNADADVPEDFEQAETELRRHIRKTRPTLKNQSIIGNYVATALRKI